MRKQQIAIIAFALWLTIVSLCMLLIQRFDIELFFVLCLLGIFVIVQLMQSNYVQPGYLQYIRYITAAGIVMFGILVAQKVMEILAR